MRKTICRLLSCEVLGMMGEKSESEQEIDKIPIKAL